MIHYHGRWAVVTGASSGLGRGLAVRLADRGMSLVLTGRNEARLDQVTQEIRRAAPRVKVETVVADLSTMSGVSALLECVGDHPIEVLINNAGFGSYGPFAEADAEREDEEVAVDVSAVINLVIPGLRNRIVAESGRFMPREWLTRITGRWLRPVSTSPQPPIEVNNEIVISAPAERVWDLLTDVESWPTWYRACRWVRIESTGGPTESAARPMSFRWKAHPVTLRSTVVGSDRPRTFAIIADGLGVHAERTFTLRPTPNGLGTVVISHETQVGLLPQLARKFLATRLRTANQAMFDDLARAASQVVATQVNSAAA
jgi:NAD(P)-dependent dehydrogenase (short-subunit alcohol dehydrogenase family)